LALRARALELAIRKRSVTAMRIWLDRYGERRQESAPERDEFDELRERRRTRAG
jgi:hypothetical protein